jgi:predicted ABC-type ATPase
VAESSKPPCIFVLAGTNGAGKSSVLGEMTRAKGADYFNPDEVARAIARANPQASQSEVNSAAWHEGKRQLEAAITNREEFAFETTLGGQTISNLLKTALEQGIEVRMWYVGLNSPELHIARVRQRVARGGHDIPEQQIRERYHSSRANLAQLLPQLTELRLFDNSGEGNPETETQPSPRLILHMIDGHVVEACDPHLRPEWTKPIFAAIEQSPESK